MKQFLIFKEDNFMENKKFDQNKYKQQFNKENYARIYIALQKDKVNKFKELCKQKGITQASIIEKAIDEFISKNQ